MFNWTISLTDRQILMLMAFAAAEDDKNGSRFDSVHSMIADAWDVRAVRRLQEDGMISVHERIVEETGFRTNVWNITRKGELIAEAIKEDTAALAQIKLRTGLESRSMIGQLGTKIYKESRKPNPNKPQRKASR